MKGGYGMSRWVLWTSVASLVIFIAWADYSEIDQVTRAQGKVIASSRSQVYVGVSGAEASVVRLRDLRDNQTTSVRHGSLMPLETSLGECA
jgi:adhesin transport system membrane fusion protein